MPKPGPIVVADAHTMSGRPRFRGTRVPVETLFINLAAGLSLDEILQSWPTLDREDCEAVLMQACDLIQARARPSG